MDIDKEEIVAENSKLLAHPSPSERRQSEYEGITFDQAMERTGGLSAFSIYTIIVFAISYVSNGYIFYALTYLEKWPKWVCEGATGDDCNAQYACAHPDKVTIDWSDHISLHNWVERLNLQCVDSVKIGLLGSMYFAGWTLGCVFVPRLGDLYGRRLPYLISLGASILFYLGLILSENVDLSIALFFFLGLCCVGKSNICYVYMLELIPSKWQTYVGTIMLFADGSTLIWLSIYFRFINKYWLWFQILGISLTCASFIGSFFVPESPKYLYSYKTFKEAKKSLAYIAKFNRKGPMKQYKFDTEVQEELKSRTLQVSTPSMNKFVSDEQVKYDLINRSDDRTGLDLSDNLGQLTKEEPKSGLKELIKNKTHLINLLCLLFLWIASAFDYYLINFQLKYISGDTFINTIVSSVSEVIAYLISGALYERIGAKVSFIGSFIIACIGSILYIFLNQYTDWVVIMVLGTKFGISASFNNVYLANSLFPPIYAATTFGICNAFARMASMLAPQFAEFPKPAPMAIFFVMSAIAGVVSFFLRTPPVQQSSFKSQNK